MNDTAKALAVILVFGAIGGGLFFALKDKAANTNLTPGSASQTNQVTVSDDEVSVIITYLSNGFVPKQVTIKSGDVVKVVNNSGAELQLQSDPHPVHSDNAELNIGLIENGESKTFIIRKTGSWGYHNHLNSSQTGIINVE